MGLVRSPYEVDETVKGLEADRDRLYQIVNKQNEAISLMLQKLVEVSNHTAEHHSVINDMGRIVTTLEEMMIGGTTDETPPAPPVS